MDELVKEFLLESHENLDRMDRDFVELEKNPSAEIVGSIFRAIHTIKGTCGFLGFPRLERLTHAGESLLSMLRDGTLLINPSIIDALLATVDAVRQILANIEMTESEGDRNDTALIERLFALQKCAVPSLIPLLNAMADSSTAAPAIAMDSTSSDDIDWLFEERTANGAQSLPKPKLGELLVQKNVVSAKDVEDALAAQAKGDPRRLGEILVQRGAVKPAAILETLQSQCDSKSVPPDSTIRVDVRVLDKLASLVGDLALARDQLQQFSSVQENCDLAASCERLNLITTELQENVMKARMQPIGNLWSKLPRLVRDLAHACGRQVRVKMEGNDTELDRTVIEAIKAPLTHLVRNSIAHGIEPPEQRVQAGKQVEGVLTFKAYHKDDYVYLEITDDGAGIDAEQIKRKALQKGLITPDHGAYMSEGELIDLIFIPGFTTAETVTNVSGRGVGMDVVKTNIERIGGRVDVHSKKGEGTTVKVTFRAPNRLLKNRSESFDTTQDERIGE